MRIAQQVHLLDVSVAEWPAVVELPRFTEYNIRAAAPEEPATPMDFARGWKPRRPMDETIAEYVLAALAWDPSWAWV